MGFFGYLTVALVCFKLAGVPDITWFHCIIPFLVWLVVTLGLIILAAIKPHWFIDWRRK